MRQLYLDCDGVLADFDKGATAILGTSPKKFEERHGLGRFWQKLASAPDFYFSLPLLPDAMRLFHAVKHLDPIILTGLPRGNWASDQKMRWAEKHFPGVRMITCMARDKRNHAKEGDVPGRRQFEVPPPLGAGGRIFIHHKNAADSIEELRAYFDVKETAPPT
jgi:hypothetical protein